jgi:hypothetical protein
MMLLGHVRQGHHARVGCGGAVTEGTEGDEVLRVLRHKDRHVVGNPSGKEVVAETHRGGTTIVRWQNGSMW